MNQCFKMFSHVSVIHITLNHGQFLLFTSDCVAGIQLYPKVVLCWIFSQSTVILSQASHTNDWQQLKLACILNAYERDWLS